ncbi:LV1 protein, partial [Upupa epops]|nr:LV1 protein [Upupa epops]
QAALTQPSSVSANPGETVQITCSGFGSAKYVGWYQQKTQASDPVTIIYLDNSRPSEGPQKTYLLYSLHLHLALKPHGPGIQDEAEAVYHCGSRNSSS